MPLSFLPHFFLSLSLPKSRIVLLGQLVQMPPVRRKELTIKWCNMFKQTRGGNRQEQIGHTRSGAELSRQLVSWLAAANRPRSGRDLICLLQVENGTNGNKTITLIDRISLGWPTSQLMKAERWIASWTVDGTDRVLATCTD